MARVDFAVNKKNAFSIIMRDDVYECVCAFNTHTIHRVFCVYALRMY